MGPSPTGMPGMGPSPTGMPGMTKGAPLPPPPPREDDSAFVRRVRLIYMDRVMREHQRQGLAELENMGREVPDWVVNLMAVLPYMSSTIFSLASILFVMVYVVQFDDATETNW
jgi:hypothetical protein